MLRLVIRICIKKLMFEDVKVCFGGYVFYINCNFLVVYMQQ